MYSDEYVSYNFGLRCDLSFCSHGLQVDKMTVDVLKGYLSNQGIKGVSKMKKAECVEKIKLHLNLK